jgi:hypothetical protein
VIFDAESSSPSAEKESMDEEPIIYEHELVFSTGDNSDSSFRIHEKREPEERLISD